MITSKEALEIIGYIDIDGRYPYPNYLKDRHKKEYEALEKYITQQETLTTKVKRYFEISSDNIGDNLDEYRRLEKEINEMVGIK